MLGDLSNVEASITRASRFAAILPDAWLQKGVPQAAKAFVEQLKKLSRSLESRRKEGLPRAAPMARKLAQALQKFGEKGIAKKLERL